MVKLKTLGDFQQIVARKYGLGLHLVTGHKASYFNEATMMYVDYLLDKKATDEEQMEMKLFLLRIEEGGANE